MRDAKLIKDATGRNVLMERRYVYQHRRDLHRCGLLDAVDYSDARRHLGSSFKIKRVWIDYKVVSLAGIDPICREMVVRSVFGIGPMKVVNGVLEARGQP